MIKCKGTETKINGSLVGTLSDFINIIMAMRQFLSKKMPEEETNKCIMTAIKIGFADDDEKIQSLSEEMMERLYEGFMRQNEVNN